jgi:hypothetical protein
MVLEVYVPYSQETFKFEIEEHEFRSFIMLETGLDVLNNEQLLDKRNIGKVVSARLICKNAKAGLPPRVMFSKQALGQRGTKKCTRGKQLRGDMFVCSLFQSSSETTIQCYHRLTSKVFVARIASNALTEWITEEYKKGCEDELSLYNTPPLLKPENSRRLYFWMIDNLMVDTRGGKYQVIFSCQLEKSNKIFGIIKIQAMMRRCRVRKLVPSWVDSYMVQVNVCSNPNNNQ